MSDPIGDPPCFAMPRIVNDGRFAYANSFRMPRSGIHSVRHIADEELTRKCKILSGCSSRRSPTFANVSYEKSRESPPLSTPMDCPWQHMLSGTRHRLPRKGGSADAIFIRTALPVSFPHPAIPDGSIAKHFSRVSGARPRSFPAYLQPHNPASLPQLPSKTHPVTCPLPPVCHSVSLTADTVSDPGLLFLTLALARLSVPQPQNSSQIPGEKRR
jgi:hypothetical protein